MKHLDWDKPYQIVCGNTSNGVRYIQDGIGFTGAGDEANPSPDAHLEGNEPDTPGRVHHTYADWHWKKLQQEVLRRGGLWTNKDNAVEWLEKDDAV